MTDFAVPLPTGVDGKELTSRGAATRERLLGAAEERLRRARLSRGLDRQDHRGGRRRAGHVLPLLRQQAGDLRGARARPEPARPACDGRRCRARTHARRGRAARVQGLLRVRRPARRALPDHPAGRVRLAADAARPLRGDRLRLHRGARIGDGARPGGADGSGGARLGADGDGRAGRHALDRLGRVPTRCRRTCSSRCRC